MQQILREYQLSLERLKREKDEAQRRCQIASASYRAVAVENEKLAERLEHVEAVFMDSDIEPMMGDDNRRPRNGGSAIHDVGGLERPYKTSK